MDSMMVVGVEEDSIGVYGTCSLSKRVDFWKLSTSEDAIGGVDETPLMFDRLREKANKRSYFKTVFRIVMDFPVHRK